MTLVHEVFLLDPIEMRNQRPGEHCWADVTRSPYWGMAEWGFEATRPISLLPHSPHEVEAGKSMPGSPEGQGGVGSEGVGGEKSLDSITGRQTPRIRSLPHTSRSFQLHALPQVRLRKRPGSCLPSGAFLPVLRSESSGPLHCLIEFQGYI